MKKIFSLFVAMMLCLPMMQGAIKVHTIGDSTMAEYDESTTDKRGWGMYLGSFFDPAFVTVNNRGKSGADTRGFYTGAAYWPSVKSQMQAGDYLLIQFAHNDEGTVTYGMDNLEYAAYCAANSLPAPTDARGTNPQTTYRDMLRAFIDEARALGVNPVLVGPICRAYFQGNNIRRNGQHDLGDKFSKIENGVLYENQSLPAGDSTMSYVKAMKVVAAEKNVPFIDLTEATRQLYLSYGETQCLSLLFCEGDKTHTNAMGGNLVARAAAQLLKNAGVLAEHITIPTDITANPNAIEIGETYCGVAQNKEFLLTGYGLEPANGTVALTATANLQISLDKVNYASTANATYSGGSMFQKVYVRANYSTGGEQLDTVYATSGEHVIAIPVSATAISLDGGAEVSATWAINARPVPAAVVEGPISAAFAMSNMACMDYSKNYFTDGDETGIVLARFHNSANGSSRTPWPAGEIDENASRYIDFAITAPEAMDVRITGISMDVTADATSTMCYHINTGFGDAFTNVMTIYEKRNLPNRAIEHVNLTPTLTVKAGQTLHVHVLPWHDYGEEKDSKYICLRNVVISGQAFAAEPGDEPGDEPGEETNEHAFGLTADVDMTDHTLTALSPLPSTSDKVTSTNVQATYAVLTNRNVYHGDATAYTAPVTYRNLANNVTIKTQADAESSDAYIAFKMTIADGYVFNASEINTDLYLDNKSNWFYEFIIEGANGLPLFKSATQTIGAGQSGTDHKATLALESETVKNLKGEITVKFIYWINSGSTLLAIKDFNIKGTVEEQAARTFTDFKVEFRDDPYTVFLPDNNQLPEGVTIAGTNYNGVQRGIYGGTVTVPVDGPVKFTIGACQFSKTDITVKKNGVNFATFSNVGPCGEQKPNYNQFVTWTYNVEEAATLTFEFGNQTFVPYFFAEACDYIAQAMVSYYDTDGTTLLGSETVDGGSALVYAYSVSDVTVPAGKAFRGWFASAEPNALKVAEGTTVIESLKLYAHATDIEVAEVGKVFNYDLTQRSFYPEDHELISITGGTYNGTQHGWQFSANGTITIEVAGNALISLALCKYGNASTLACVDANSNPVGEPITLPVAADGNKGVFRYTGPATTLTFTLSNGGYVHAVKVYNLEQVPTLNEAGYYVIGAGDAAGLVLALETAQPYDKIFLPNGIYDLGTATLTHIDQTVSLIGQSMEGVLIQNHPLAAGMNNAETFYIGADNVYLQDLAIRCDVSYEGSSASGVGIAVQVRGDKSIMKQVDLQGNQDTYYSSCPATARGYFEDGRIEGTVDYICGGGDMWFENTLLYNNARAHADVILAPSTAAETVYGYVLNNCTIDGDESQAGRWNLARGWHNSPAATFLNATCLIAPSAQGYTYMSADLPVRFHEYNTHLEDGTPVTGHNLNGLNYAANSDAIYLEAIGNYTYDNVVKGADNWDARAIAAQAVANSKVIDGDAAYLIEDEGTFVALLKGSELNLASYIGKTLRKANTRGGFGAPATIEDTETGVENVNLKSEIINHKFIRNGQLLIVKDGKTYNAQGIQIQ